MKRRLRRASDADEKGLAWRLAGRSALRHYALTGDFGTAICWAASNFELSRAQLGTYVESQLSSNRAFKMLDPGLTWQMVALKHKLDMVENRLGQLSSEVRRSGSFCQNVFTNVVANLIAGAIVYLLGVAGGYIRASPALVGLSLFLVVVPALLSMIMVGYGGYRYITSGGDSGSVSAAKNTIIYAFVIVLASPILWGPAWLGYNFSTRKDFVTPVQISNWLLFVVVLALVARLFVPKRYRWITHLVAALGGTFTAMLLSGLLVGYIWG